MHRMLSATCAAALAVGLAGAAVAADYAWQPEQPVTIIVPWAAGGSTDQVTRLVAGELEAALGQSFVIVNQPGASGSVGTKNAWDAPHDGMTWAAGAASDLGTYPVLGMLDNQLGGLGAVPRCRQCQRDRRQSGLALSGRQPAARRDEGQSRPGLGRDRGAVVGRPQRDGGDRPADRRRPTSTSPTTAATRR